LILTGAKFPVPSGKRGEKTGGGGGTESHFPGRDLERKKRNCVNKTKSIGQVAGGKKRGGWQATSKERPRHFGKNGDPTAGSEGRESVGKKIFTGWLESGEQRFVEGGSKKSHGFASLHFPGSNQD